MTDMGAIDDSHTREWSSAYSAIRSYVGSVVRSRSVTATGPQPVRKYPRICVDIGSTLIKMLAVQIWALCVPASPWELASPV